MSDTVVTNQLPPRTNVSHRWPRKWATLGGRGAPSTTIPPLAEIEANGKTNGHRQSMSLFRKSSTISRTTAPRLINPELSSSDNASLKKSRSLINVLRSKLNSPAVLRRFRTKSRENGKQTVTEVVEPPTITEETNKKYRKRDPSPMRRLTSRLAQLTRSSTHNTMSPDQVPQGSPTRSDQDQVDHINACYDEIRAKYFDQMNTTSLLTQHSSAQATERLKEMLSTTTTSSVDYYDRPNLTNGEPPNRSLSTISINGSLLSHDLLNNSQQNVPSASPPLKPRTPDDPLLVARKQSNIKLNCMLSGYVYKNPFATHERLFGQNDIFKFHHYHDVGKQKFDWNMTNDNNRMYSSMRVRPMSRSIDSFRRATTTIETDLIPTDPMTTNEHLLVTDEKTSPVATDEPFVIRENVETERKTYKSKIHIQPAATVHVKTFVSSTSPPNQMIKGKNDEFERNFLRAVDRALGLTSSDMNNLLQPIYDTPINKEVHLENGNLFDDDQLVNGNESPSVELFDRTGEMYFDNDQQNWQSSAVYDDQQALGIPDEHQIQTNVWSVAENSTQKTQDFLSNELKNGQDFLVMLDGEEKFIKNKADAYGNILSSNDQRLSEEIQSEIQATIGEVHLLLRGKLKQFRGLCQANVAKSTTSAGEPTPLDSDLAGFWDITHPLISKIKEKFVKLDACRARHWIADDEQIDPADVSHHPRKIGAIKSKSSSSSKSANVDLKKLIDQRRKAASSGDNQNCNIEIFHVTK